MSRSGSRALVIRADADDVMGAGHVMRCLALAEAWQDEGGSAYLLADRGTEFLAPRLEQAGITVSWLAAPRGEPRQMPRALVAQATKWQAAVVVVDGYHFDASYRAPIAERFRLLIVDDLGDTPPYEGRWILNQTPLGTRRLYTPSEQTPSSKLVPELLTGHPYALMRREVRQAALRRGPPGAERSRYLPDVGPPQVLVTLGGSDQDQLSAFILDALARVPLPVAISVLAGPATGHGPAVTASARACSHPVTLLPPASSLPGMVQSASLGICAGGGTARELACLGIPTLVVALAENQRPLAAELADGGAALSVGWHEDLDPETLTVLVDDLLQDEGARTQMAHAGRILIDGLGASRVVARMLT